MIGETLGSYRVVSKLGEGGMGVVYVAEHPLIGRKAAIKVLLPALSADQEIVNRFFNEARTTAMIRHPGLVDVFDFGYHASGSAYLAMELLDGESLGARLRREHRLPVGLALVVGRQVADALAAAHAKGIVHRDLKPDNLFLVPDRNVVGGVRVKVLDFGIAKLAQEGGGSGVKTRTGAVMGTPLYMSPEQCKGSGAVDHRSDVYALGCILYECVSGRPPFGGEGFGEIIGKHMYEPAVPVGRVAEGVPVQLDALIMRALAKPAGDRFQSMQELEAALDLVPAQPLATASQPDLATAKTVTPVSNPAAFAGTLPTPPQQQQVAATVAPPSTLGQSAAEAVPRSVPPSGAGRYSRKRWLYGGASGAIAVAAVAIVAITAGGGQKASNAPLAARPVTPEPLPADAAVALAFTPPDAGQVTPPDAAVAPPEAPSFADEVAAMVARVQPRVNRCADPNGVADTISLRIGIGAEGAVFQAEALGDFTGTKVGHCVEGVLKHAKLKGTGKRESTTVKLKLVPGKGGAELPDASSDRSRTALADALKNYKLGKYKLVIQEADESLAIEWDPALARIAAMAACKSKDPDKAKQYVDRAPSMKGAIQKLCAENGVELK